MTGASPSPAVAWTAGLAALGCSASAAVAVMSGLGPLALLLGAACVGLVTLLSFLWRAREAALAQPETHEGPSPVMSRSALDQIAWPIRIADAEGRVVYVNQALQNVLDRDAAPLREEQRALDPTTVVGESIGDLHADPTLAPALQPQAPRVSGDTGLRLGGRCYDVITTPILTAEGQSLGTVDQWRDVTEDRKAEAEQRVGNPQLQVHPRPWLPARKTAPRRSATPVCET